MLDEGLLGRVKEWLVDGEKMPPSLLLVDESRVGSRVLSLDVLLADPLVSFKIVDLEADIGEPYLRVLVETWIEPGKEDEEDRVELYEFLLKLSYHAGVKAYIDFLSGKVALAVDLPSSAVSPEALVDAMSRLARSALALGDKLDPDYWNDGVLAPAALALARIVKRLVEGGASEEEVVERLARAGVGRDAARAALNFVKRLEEEDEEDEED